MMGNNNQYTYEITEEGIRLTEYLGGDEEIVLPEEIDGMPVRILGSNCFYNLSMDIRIVRVPGSVRRIETNAFNLCLSLEELELSEGLEELEPDFLIVTQQEELWIPSTVRRIGEPGAIPVALRVSPENPWYFTDGYALYRREYGAEGQTGLVLETTLIGSAGASLRLPEGVTGIAEDAFANQEGLEEIWLPATLEFIGEGALADSRDRFRPELGIRTIHIAPENPWYFIDETGMYRHLPDGGLKLIKYSGSQKDLILGAEIREISTGAFTGSGIERVTLPGPDTKLRPDCFFGCPIREVVFGTDGDSILCPSTHPYLQKQVLDGFGANGKLYDFSFYDRALSDEALSAAKMKMICFRLLHPEDLPEETAARYRRIVGGNLDYTIDLLMEQRDSLTIRMMAELGFFTADNIDHIIDRYAGSDDKDALAVLLDYRHEHLSQTGFDFSL